MKKITKAVLMLLLLINGIGKINGQCTLTYFDAQSMADALNCAVAGDIVTPLNPAQNIIINLDDLFPLSQPQYNLPLVVHSGVILEGNYDLLTSSTSSPGTLEIPV